MTLIDLIVNLKLDLVDRDNDSKVHLSTYLKLIKLTNQKPKAISEDSSTKKDSFEFEISESVVSFCSAELTSKSKSKYTVKKKTIFLFFCKFTVTTW